MIFRSQLKIDIVFVTHCDDHTYILWLFLSIYIHIYGLRNFIILSANRRSDLTIIQSLWNFERKITILMGRAPQCHGIYSFSIALWEFTTNCWSYQVQNFTFKWSITFVTFFSNLINYLSHLIWFTLVFVMQSQYWRFLKDNVWAVLITNWWTKFLMNNLDEQSLLGWKYGAKQWSSLFN